MIKAEELRIGNLVESIHYFHGNVLVKVDLNELDLISKSEKRDNDSQYYGIHLTEEILLKCGFSKIIDSVYYDRLAKLEITTFCGDLKGFFYKVKNGYKIEIKYLHQLQNLYFALTGNELEITL